MKQNINENNWPALERFFIDSFCDGQVQRELRLSLDERRYLEIQYPNASFQPLYDDKVNSPGKLWYLVTIHLDNNI